MQSLAHQKKHRQVSVSRRCPPGQKLARDGIFRLVPVPLVVVPVVLVVVPVVLVPVLVPVLVLVLDLPLERLLFSLICSLLTLKPASLLDRLVEVPVLVVRVVRVVPVLVVRVVPVLVVLVPVVLVPSVLSSSIAGITSTHSQSQVSLFCSCKALHSRPLVGH